MKKSCILFFMLYLFIPAVFADISLKTDQHIYNLGNKVKVSGSVLNDKTFEGLFKLELSCGNYKLQYFLTPISLEANFRTALNIPELTITSGMLENCVLTGDLTTNENIAVETKESEAFTITDALQVLPVRDKITSLPGSSIQIAGIVNEAFGNNVLEATAEIQLDDNKYPVDALDGKFNTTLKLQKNIKAGIHIIGIHAADQRGNVGDSSIGLGITAVPNYIKIELSEQQLMPGSKINILSSIYDQADDLINASLDLELNSPKNEKVFRKIVQSNENMEYEFSQYAVPGTYVFASTYNELSSQSSINISTVREVKVIYSNETVAVENIGNVIYDDELTFLVENEQKKYPVTRKVKIEPSKTLYIDLSTEVPYGIYDILVPLKEGLEPIALKSNATLSDVIASAKDGISGLLPQGTSLLAGDVTIHDNRPWYKKILK